MYQIIELPLAIFGTICVVAILILWKSEDNSTYVQMMERRKEDLNEKK